MRRSLSVVIIDLGKTPEEHSSALLELLRSHLRQVDFVSAISQHELVVAMPDTDTHAEIPTERVLRQITAQVPAARAGVSRCPADASDPDALFVGARRAAKQTISVTISIGLANLSSLTTTPTPTSLLAASDKALYAAKEGGRNRVSVAGTNTPM